ncbi:MAG: HD domain-containing protein [Acidobacteria bacterium]|nr:HD domain-containing protein [Acidobacteriota bacterium]
MPRSLHSRRWIPAAVAALLLAGLAPFLRVPRSWDFSAFVVFVMLGELMEVRIAGGTTTSLGIAPALAYAFLGHPIAEVVFCFAGGAAAAAVLGQLVRRPSALGEIPLRGVVVAAAAGAYALTDRLGGAARFGPTDTPISIAGLGVSVAIVLGLGTLLRALPVAARDRVPWRPVFAGSMRSAGPVDLSSVSAGTLLALAYPVLRGWSLPLFLAPLAATHYSFQQLASIKRTYLQTIRALSRVPEMALYTRPGHSARVAALSVGIAREMGISDTSEIEYAALLHDIGRLSLADADPDAGASQRLELALVGAAIVEETGHFPRVAEMIRTQHEPFRRRGENTGRNLPAGARIIKVASAYDDLTCTGGPARSPWDALERLRSGAGQEHDPAVIQALSRILDKRGDV